MRKIGFISDFFKDDLLGGGEINDSNLINHLELSCDIDKFHSRNVQIADIEGLDSLIIGNFTMLHPDVVEFLINEKEYIIYEHDHKYVDTRDPSKFKDFQIPESRIINRPFYESSVCTVVLSKICAEVLNNTIPKTLVYNIGCSLWSDETFDLLSKINKNEDREDLCIMKNMNPTKNYLNTLQYCKDKGLDCGEIQPAEQVEFLTQMAQYKKLLFIPTVLETFSRLCAEAKMLNLDVMTNKSMIGFFSEEYSDLKGDELIECMKERNQKALSLFEEVV